MLKSLTQYLRCTGGPVPDFRPRVVALAAWSVVLIVRVIRNSLPTKQNRDFRHIASDVLHKQIPTKLYFASRWPCEHEGRLCEPLGVALTEAEAVAMCSLPIDAVQEVEVGRHYREGEIAPVKTIQPYCTDCVDCGEKLAWVSP